MGIETGNYINDLDADWPLATDNVSDGDNHLRLIKKVLKDSFPGVDRVSEYIYVHSSAPTVDVGIGRLWLDTSGTPNLLKICDAVSPSITFKKLPISATVDYKLMGNDTVGWTLPTADGTANYPLVTSGSGALSFSQIATAAIADNAVDGAKIAMGSDAAGDVLYHNGTDYVRLAKPATPKGEALTFAPSAVAPSWVAPALVDVTHAIQSASSTIRSTTYVDTGFSIAHTKISATSTLFVQVEFKQSTYSSFDEESHAYLYMQLTNSSGTIIANTTANIEVFDMKDKIPAGLSTIEFSTCPSRIFKVAAADCPDGTTGANTFKVYVKQNSSADCGTALNNGIMMVWEIEE